MIESLTFDRLHSHFRNCVIMYVIYYWRRVMYSQSLPPSLCVETYMDRYEYRRHKNIDSEDLHVYSRWKKHTFTHVP